MRCGEVRAAGARTASGERRDSRDGAEGATRRRFFVTAKAVTHKTTAGACDERGGLGGARFGMLAGMDIKITDVEARVLGALIEKEITTPEYYPLSLNALVNACNQKSNREPVMNLDEDAVVAAMRGLEKNEFAGAANTTDSRVRKYEHRLQEVFNFTRPETAALCVLLLRGAQTPGEIRGRAERLHHFEALDDVQLALGKLMKREPSMAAVLPRQPGTKESRYLELMSGEVGAFAAQSTAAGSARSGSARDEAFSQHIENAAPSARRDGSGERFARLEAEVAELRGEIAALKAQFAEFRKQFE
jgi:uncharacterized protein YceH (UPF0502 family)